MSSQSHHNMSGKSSKLRADEEELTKRFSEQMAQLCMNEDYSDVAFIVESQRLPAHRCILAARSEYFRALLFGGLSESNQREIELRIPLQAFKALLKYIYSGHMPLALMDEENILDTLGLANQYGFTELELSISEYLRQYLDVNNACAILDAARLYHLDTLTNVCLTFMDRNADAILSHDSFKSLSKESLEVVLRRDSFYAPEVQIFIGVSEWCAHNSHHNDTQSIVSHVRLPLIKLEHLLTLVRSSNIIDPDKLLDAIEEQTTSKYLAHRAAFWPDENVATPEFRANAIQGECRQAVIDGDTTSYDMERGYARHCITDANDMGIVIELGSICQINHLKMLLWDRDSRAYSYFIEVSANQTQWDRVIDYTEYHCRSWQYLFFKPRPVRFIKLVGTHNTVNKVFHVVAVEAILSTTVPKLINDIVVPTSNVATVDMGAIVVDGVSRTRNALLNGDYINYDWDSGYTCHQLGSGDIVVRLGQPYYIGSLRLLLWDCDDRTYSYYIETSVNQKDWTMVVDKRNEMARSWQNCSFTPRPVVFIRIVGTRNTANEIFHIVHLECPSQDQTFLQMEKEKIRTISASNIDSNTMDMTDGNINNISRDSSISNDIARSSSINSNSSANNNNQNPNNNLGVNEGVLIHLDNAADENA